MGALATTLVGGAMSLLGGGSKQPTVTNHDTMPSWMLPQFQNTMNKQFGAGGLQDLAMQTYQDGLNGKVNQFKMNNMSRQIGNQANKINAGLNSNMAGSGMLYGNNSIKQNNNANTSAYVNSMLADAYDKILQGDMQGALQMMQMGNQLFTIPKTEQVVQQGKTSPWASIGGSVMNAGLSGLGSGFSDNGTTYNAAGLSTDWNNAYGMNGKDYWNLPGNNVGSARGLQAVKENL